MNTTRSCLALALAASLAGCSSTPDEPDKYGAQDVCEQFVGKRLKAPATAEYENTTTSQAGNKWTVEGDVDSENGFGALVRSHYTCTVKPTDAEGNNWELVDIQVDE